MRVLFDHTRPATRWWRITLRQTRDFSSQFSTLHRLPHWKNISINVKEFKAPLRSSPNFSASAWVSKPFAPKFDNRFKAIGHSSCSSFTMTRSRIAPSERITHIWIRERFRFCERIQSGRTFDWLGYMWRNRWSWLVSRTHLWRPSWNQKLWRFCTSSPQKNFLSSRNRRWLVGKSRLCWTKFNGSSSEKHGLCFKVSSNAQMRNAVGKSTRPQLSSFEACF